MSEDFQEKVIDRLARIETKLDDVKDIRDKANSADNRSINNEKRINEIEDNNKWLWRTAVGGLIVGAIGIIFNFIKLNIG